MVPYAVHRRRGMRHLRVMVNEQNEVIMKVPHGISETAALEFLHDNADWILEILQTRPKRQTLMEFLNDQRRVSGLGRWWEVSIGFSKQNQLLNIDREAGRLGIALPSSGETEKQLLLALKAFAKEVIPERTRFIANGENLRLSRVTVRDQRTLWGSCTDRSTLSLNWRLILLPPILQDHVIKHELAHLKELNHSDAFWRCLEAMDPKWHEHDQQITRLSPQIMHLGR